MADETHRTASAPPPDTPAATGSSGGIARIRAIAGLVALVSGTLVVFAVALAALLVDHGSASQIATSAFGVVGSIVGAYFGVKIGSDGTRDAVEAHREESAKAQAFAAHVPAADADRALEVAAKWARDVRPEGSR